MNKRIENYEYRKSLGISQSTLKGFDECPAFVRYLEGEERKYPTDEMIIGSVVESELLGTEFRYEESPYDDYRSKDAREWRDGLRIAGVPIVTQSMRERIQAMVKVARLAFRTVNTEAGTSSIGIWREHPETGLMRRGLIDWVPLVGKSKIVDLKCLADPSPSGFARTAVNLRYDIQEAYYTRLFQEEFGEPTRRRMEWWVVGNSEPHLTGVYYIPERYIQAADAQIDFWLGLYKKHTDAKSWPSYTAAGAVEVDLPKFFTPFAPVC